jgi:hypothetical protein
MRIQDLTEASMNVTVYLDAESCTVLDAHVSEVLLLSSGPEVLIMEDINTSKILVKFYQTIRCNIPEEFNVQTL